MSKEHDVLVKLKDLASQLGRMPTRDEYAASYGFDYRSAFGSFTVALRAAGADGREMAKQHKAEKFKFKKTQIESFNVHDINFEDLFTKGKDVFKIIAQPDTHVHNRDHKAVDVFLKFMEWYKPDGHIIMGDFLDAEGISHWPSNSLKPKRFIPEVIEGRELLKKIVNITPSAKLRIFIIGNHCSWLDQALIAKLPELYDGIDELGLMPTIESLLDLEKFGYQTIPLNDLLKVGKAYFTHGLYVGGAHPKKHLDTIKANIYYGHLHDILSTHQPSIHGFIEAASLGCLCRLDAPFMKGKPTNWVHGFGIFEFRRDGSYSFYQVRIFDGVFSFNGKIFKAD